MKVNIEKQPKSTIKMTITVPSDAAKAAYDEVIDAAVKTTEVEGFRKGNAPKHVVEEKVGIPKLHGEAMNKLLQTYYTQALKESKIAPVSNPRVEVKEFNINKDFEFTAEVAVRPEIKIGEYKKALKTRHKEKAEEQRKNNEEKIKKGEKLEDMHLSANDVIAVLVDSAQMEIADILIEEETNRMMARLVDQAQAVGMSMDQYLNAQKKTAEELRTDYDKISKRNLEAEFIMSHLIGEEKIVAEDKEIQEMIKASGLEDADKRAQDPMEMMYVKSILQKNKLITKLIAEAEKDEK
ncbi:trigger factor [bacterium]|nr:trigger factor [bacterium]